jgi:polygalacturonase
MLPVSRLFALAIFWLPVAAAVQAQDTRHVSEPKFPPVCAVFQAPLKSALTGSPVVEQDFISKQITDAITRVFDRCSGKAIELALGFDTRYNAFLINPISFPPGVSLIVDGGVTVYASRNPVNYQIPNSTNLLCGTLAEFGSDKTTSDACRPLLTFEGNDEDLANSGLYGYGVLDGQNQLPMLFSTPPPKITPDECKLYNKTGSPGWWDLINAKDNCSIKDKVNENSPFMVSAGEAGANGAGSFTIYKLTIRNPPFHNVNWGGDGLTVWGAHIQAPWNVPNTDGLNLHGSKITVYDTIVSNGDDDITFATGDADTEDITIKRFSAYSRDGLTVFGNSDGKYRVSNLQVEDVTMTGDLPSVVTTTVNGKTTNTVNGVSEDILNQNYGINYARALPNAGGDVHGLNIKWGDGSSITDVTFRNVCLQDIKTPLNIEQPASGATATLNTISFENIHILPPNPQFLSYTVTGDNGDPGSGRYDVNFQGFANSQGNAAASFTLSNVVFDDLAGGKGTSLDSIVASYNSIGTFTNVYPAVFNLLDGSGTPPALPVLTIKGNSYGPRTSTSTPSLANPCNTSLPFITGELYASAGTVLATGADTNLNALTAKAGGTITLNEVVQPIMSQTTYPMWGKGTKDNLVAIGSPVLTNAVRFYDGVRYIGSASLTANGTLARLQIDRIAPGWHIYTAQYPKDAFYSNLNFGLIVVYATPQPFVRNPR